MEFERNVVTIVGEVPMSGEILRDYGMASGAFLEEGEVREKEKKVKGEKVLLKLGDDVNDMTVRQLRRALKRAPQKARVVISVEWGTEETDAWKVIRRPGEVVIS